MRRAVQDSDHHIGLLAALHDLPVLERDGNINRTKLGHFLRRNAKRIVTGHRFEKAHADGRVAWKVVRVDTPASGTEGGTTPGAADEADSVF